MAIGSGLGSQFGYVAESTYGTAVTVSNFLRVRDFDLQPAPNRVQGDGIQSGVYGPLAAHYVETTSAGTGSFSCDVQSRGMGVLFQQLMGATGSSAQQGATAAYLHTFNLGDPTGKSLTVQGGRPVRGGTSVPFTMKGTKIVSGEFSCAVGELLQASFQLDGRAVENTTALASASYVATNVFHWAQFTAKAGTYGAESSVAGVRGFSVAIERPQDVDDYTAGAAGLKSEPVLNERTSISGSISADWTAKATFEDVALTTADSSLVLEFVGPVIASTYYETWRLTLPSVTYEPMSQGVSGAGELTADWPFTWRYDGTNLPTIEYISTDTTI